MLRRPSALDQIVQNFQHNWETNPQFRAMWSGGLGLAIVVMLCACLGFAFTFASAAASAVNSANTGSSNNGSVAPNGTVQAGSADNVFTFPTATVAPWPVPQIPQAGLIPPSTTPAPTPSPLPTATPVPTSATGPGGGGGGGGGGGNAGSVTITATNPSPLQQGAAGSVTIHTSQGNVPVVFNITWQTGGFDPMTNGGGGYVTDSNGNYTLNFNVPSGGCTNGGNSTIKFWLIAGFPGGTVQPTITEQCTQ